MRYHKGQYLILNILLLFCSLVVSSCDTPSIPYLAANEELKLSQNDPSCSVLGWIPYWDQQLALDSFHKNVNIINYVSLFWYNITRDGKIKKYRDADEDRQIISFAHKHGVKVFALVANLPDKEKDMSDWDFKRIAKIITSEQNRRAHISDLIKLTHKFDFDGINIDYESLPAKYRQDFTKFIQELGNALHKNNKLLAVALHPKTSENNPKEDNGSHAQDWDQLYAYVDQLHLMTYGEHTVGSDPGPIASLQWVEGVVRYAVKKRDIPPNKLYLGIPLYAEGWQELGENDDTAYRSLDIDLTFIDVQRLISKYQADEIWSNKYTSPNIIYHPDSNTRRVIWYENNRSITAKLALGNKYGVCNAAFWRLGGEDPDIWKTLCKSRSKKCE